MSWSFWPPVVTATSLRQNFSPVSRGSSLVRVTLLKRQHVEELAHSMQLAHSVAVHVFADSDSLAGRPVLPFHLCVGALGEPFLPFPCAGYSSTRSLLHSRPWWHDEQLSISCRSRSKYYPKSWMQPVG